MPTNKTTTQMNLIDARIEPVQSQYSDAIASVRATLIFETAGRSTARDERHALAIAHRIAADLLAALDAMPSYTAPQVEVRGSYKNRVEVAVRYELCTGAQDEADAIVALMHDVVPAPEA